MSNTKSRRNANPRYGTSAPNFKHGKNPTGLYTSWLRMRSRCRYPGANSYHRYGGRGIKVCPEWNDFRVFREWALLHGWSTGLKIDRINNDGDYHPANCRWVTAAENNRNSTSAKLSQADVGRILSALANRSKTSVQLAEEYDVAPGTIHRIKFGTRWAGAFPSKVVECRALPRTKITQQIADEIRLALSSGGRGTARHLAAHYGVNESSVSQIRHGKTWKTNCTPRIK